MKKLFFYGSLYFIFFSANKFDTNELRTATFIIENKTSEEVKIRTYNENTFSKELLINPIYRQEFSFYERDHDEVSYTFADVFVGDSIRIIFNDKKVSIYICKRKYNPYSQIGCTNNRNPYNDYILEGSTRIYYITQEDYNNAEDCEGNCE